jgi:hypothetical protein
MKVAVRRRDRATCGSSLSTHWRPLPLASADAAEPAIRRRTL